ncbi:Glucosamine-6-phosphate deaminase [Lactobacillus equicursoris 66c]|uniref:Glucosamine-6-phosphate deaminase n=1 Tax=Lactobacillus equicursoris 66c TaxID=872326 RepID=K0NUA9_9LACO|nr:glucosamine-6-phosphate deaminase [Lactobacillus equicursoris]CCK82845.1 Glucosamine-6-phosphate deaminase [Lactobacillus equicursoris 66c]
MKVIVAENASELGKQAFKLLAEAVAGGAKTLGLATGSSPVELYQEIVASDLDFTDMTSINLDEYVGLAPDNVQSYHYFMQEHLFKFKPFKASYVPDGLAKDVQAECDRYNQLIKDNPIDLQVLGIGQNGHIAFNEPGTPFDSVTHEVALTESTIQANSRFFDSIDQVPKSAICMGISNIMTAKEILLIAKGKNKAQAVKDMLEGPITEAVPASVLQKHPHVTVVLDQDAASLLD